MNLVDFILAYMCTGIYYNSIISIPLYFTIVALIIYTNNVYFNVLMLYLLLYYHYNFVCISVRYYGVPIKSLNIKYTLCTYYLH